MTSVQSPNHMTIKSSIDQAWDWDYHNAGKYVACMLHSQPTFYDCKQSCYHASYVAHMQTRSRELDVCGACVLLKLRLWTLQPRPGLRYRTFTFLADTYSAFGH